jgi:hypothetical protein
LQGFRDLFLMEEHAYVTKVFCDNMQAANDQLNTECVHQLMIRFFYRKPNSGLQNRVRVFYQM